MPHITLVSTVVAPSFSEGQLVLTKEMSLEDALTHVTRNLCGHPITSAVLAELYPGLPAPEKGFWNGEGLALAVRPKGGVRGAQAQGDTPVTLADLEYVLFSWHPEG